MAISKYGYVSLEALYEYAMNQKDHSITPNDFMRMNRADVIPIEWIKKWLGKLKNVYDDSVYQMLEDWGKENETN